MFLKMISVLRRDAMTANAVSICLVNDQLTFRDEMLVIISSDVTMFLLYKLVF